MLDLSVISRQRKALMGVAILLIMLYHSSVIFEIPIFRHLFSNGDIGVELFAVLSGIGIYHSLSKNSIIVFYKKRIARIVPSFLLVSIPYSLFLLLCRGASWKYFVSLVSGIAPLLGDYTFWFVSFIMLCYLVSPVLFLILSRTNTYGLLAIATFICTYFLMLLFPCQLSPLMWLFRFSDFVLGMEVARVLFDNESPCKEAPKYVLCYLFFLVIIAMLLTLVRDASYVVRYFSYFITVIPILFSLAFVLEHCQCMHKVFCFLGNFTLEIYLLHEHICIPVAELLHMPIWITCAISMILAIFIAFSISQLRSGNLKILA